MEEIIVRRAELQDHQSLVDFNSQMAYETEGKTLNPETISAGVLGVLSNPQRGFYTVAIHGSEVVGCLMVTFEWSDWRNCNFYWIQSVYVKPEFRRTGIFRRLYDTVFAMARENSGAGVRLYVDKDNQTAQAVYTALGMKLSHYDTYEVDFHFPS